ncbi:MAG: radical SAM protein [Firmicutes bacterium HGW-Firmicutes-8]|nr:MAG: radical SAM protein [Firmicutes bacterium HGW-Firmicutes-8]
MFQLLYADQKGRMYEHPDLLAGGRTGNIFTEILEGEAIPLPEGASLVLIPEGIPVGINRKGKFTSLYTDGRGKPVFAVGALLPQGYTRTYIPSYRRDDKKPLPLLGYAAVGWKDGVVYTAAMQTDDTDKWNPLHFSTQELGQLVEDAVSAHGSNRIIQQLGRCALEYSCFTAQNIFYRRWEGGIPVSPSCNARCLGCISLQPAECCPSPQGRIGFQPSGEEILEVALPHLTEAADAIISFGQGCEGEPSLSAPEISAAVEKIRRQTQAGTINMNTNAGYTEGIKIICQAGIDSLRVSTISAREQVYAAYYAPRDYCWGDVTSSIRHARRQGVYVSLNLLTLPGLTDQPEEVEALVEFVREHDINMIQLRNLNIDPDYLATVIPMDGKDMLGIAGLIDILKTEIPQLEIGNYSKPVVK